MNALFMALERGRGSVIGVTLQLLLVCLILTRSRLEDRLGRRWRVFADASLWAGLLFMGVLAAVDAAAGVRLPRAWDFPSFYCVARAAAQGRDFYDPQVLAAIQRQVHVAAAVPNDWLHEVGYWYLPPSMVLLLPLGFLGYRLALVLHYVLQGTLLVGSAVLMHRAIPLGHRFSGWAMMMLLLLLFAPVQSTVFLAQLVFGSMFFWLLSTSLMERSGPASGVAAMVGFLYNHLLLIPSALALFSRDGKIRKSGLIALCGIAVALLAAALILGPRVFRAYAAHGPAARSPALAVDPVVQSLLAMLYRGLRVSPSGTLFHVLAFPPFVALAAALTAATIVIVRRSPIGTVTEQAGLVLCLALLCYPNTLFSGLAMLLPVTLGIYAGAMRRGVPFIFALGFVVLVYGVAGYAPAHAGWLSFACWCAAAGLLVPAGSRIRRAAPAMALIGR